MGRRRREREARGRRWILAAALGAALAAGSSLADEEVDRGAALYGNHCAACHDETLHDRGTRLVRSREELYGWVAGWSLHLGLDWRDRDIEDVTSYLSRRLYRFSDR